MGEEVEKKKKKSKTKKEPKEEDPEKKKKKKKAKTDEGNEKKKDKKGKKKKKKEDDSPAVVSDLKSDTNANPESATATPVVAESYPESKIDSVAATSFEDPERGVPRSAGTINRETGKKTFLIAGRTRIGGPFGGVYKRIGKFGAFLIFVAGTTTAAVLLSRKLSPTSLSSCDPDRPELPANADMRSLVSDYLNLQENMRRRFPYGSPMGCWKTGAVTNMDQAFANQYHFTGEGEFIGDWNTESVTSMSDMFSSSAFNQPLNDWDVSSVTDMSYMFYGDITGITASFFNQPLNDWDVSSVTDMSHMFFKARAFNQPLNDWDVSSVTDMSHMFQWASAFNQPLNDWDVSSVTDMSVMFQWASAFNQPLNDWDVSLVTDMSYMFYGDLLGITASAFNQPLNDWDVSSVTDMSGVFYGASAFNQCLSDWAKRMGSTSVITTDMFSASGCNSDSDPVSPFSSIDDNWCACP